MTDNTDKPKKPKKPKQNRKSQEYKDIRRCPTCQFSDKWKKHDCSDFTGQKKYITLKLRKGGESFIVLYRTNLNDKLIQKERCFKKIGREAGLLKIKNLLPDFFKDYDLNALLKNK